jgi:hypothetical protein
MWNWFSTPQGFAFLAGLLAVNAVLTWLRGDSVLAAFLGVVGVAVAIRAWRDWRRRRVSGS